MLELLVTGCEQQLFSNACDPIQMAIKNSSKFWGEITNLGDTLFLGNTFLNKGYMHSSVKMKSQVF